MKFKLAVVVLPAALLLSACTGGMMHQGAMQGMDHSQMMSETMTHTMTMSDTMPMHMGDADHTAMMGMMNQMQEQMQGMMDGTMPTDATAMQTMMDEMASMTGMMNEMHTMMMNGSMPMESQSHMDEMTSSMSSMMQMMEKMHGSVEMSPEQMAQMQSHMAEMNSMMQMMHGMMGDSMPMTGTMPMSDTMAGMDHAGMNHGAMMADPSKPFDAQFIDSMIIHHQGAVDMANEVLQKAEHAELKQFAEAIIAAQTQEISDMQSWRQSWYPDLADTGGMSMGMGDMAISSDESIPFDQRFLTAMISHHQGAIDMAQMALQMGTEHAEIKTLSEAIITAQQAEIEQMKGWLKAWYNQ